MDPETLLQAKVDRVREAVKEHLAPDEQVRAVLALATGPLSPLTPLIPVFGVLLAMTRWLRGYAIVVTDQNLLLLRTTKGRRWSPKELDLRVPVDRVRVVSWVQKRGSAILVIDADGRRIRLHVVGQYFIQAAPVLEALGYVRG